MIGSLAKLVRDLLRPLYYRAYTLYLLRSMPKPPAVRERLTFSDRQFILEFCPALLGSGEDLVVYDIGAASGMFSTCVAKLSQVREVHAFEPIPSAFEELVSATAKHGVRIVCHNMALGAFNGLATMGVIQGARDSSSILRTERLFVDEACAGREPTIHEQLVRVARLDDYVGEKRLPRPDVVKLDVQGYEDRVLCGGHQTIASARFCVLEVSFEAFYKEQALFDDIYWLMHDMGFRLVGIGNAPVGHSPRQIQTNAVFKRV